MLLERRSTTREHAAQSSGSYSAAISQRTRCQSTGVSSSGAPTWPLSRRQTSSRMTSTCSSGSGYPLVPAAGGARP